MKIIKYWSLPKQVFDSLIVLTDEGIIISNPSENEHPGISQEIEKGNLDAIKKPSVIPFNKIKKIKANRKDADIKVNYHKKETKNLLFNDMKTRDEVFTQIKNHLGDKATLSTKEYSPVRASFQPIITLIICGALTFAGYMGAKGLAAGGTAVIKGRRIFIKKIFYWLMETLGPTGFIIVGSLIGIGIIYWLVKRVQDPPTIDSLSLNK